MPSDHIRAGGSRKEKNPGKKGKGRYNRLRVGKPKGGESLGRHETSPCPRRWVAELNLVDKSRNTKTEGGGKYQQTAG